MLIRNRNIDSADKRDAMTRLLVDGLTPDGLVCVNYDQQWKTLTKARDLGYVDADYRITEAGRKRIAKSGAA
jgi:hypothetical protein